MKQGLRVVLLLLYFDFSIQLKLAKYETPGAFPFDKTNRDAYSSTHCATLCAQTGWCFGFQLTSEMTCKISTCLDPEKFSPSRNATNQLYLNLDIINGLSIALGRHKPATLSFVRNKKEAHYCNDGTNVTDNWSLICHSEEESDPWWRVDLETSFCIFGVGIANRNQLSYWQRTRNAAVTVSDDVDSIYYVDEAQINFCGYHVGTLYQVYTAIVCTKPLRGRYVQVQLKSYTTLNLMEVDVYGI